MSASASSVGSSSMRRWSRSIHCWLVSIGNAETNPGAGLFVGKHSHNFGSALQFLVLAFDMLMVRMRLR